MGQAKSCIRSVLRQSAWQAKSCTFFTNLCRGRDTGRTTASRTVGCGANSSLHVRSAIHGFRPVSVSYINLYSDKNVPNCSEMLATSFLAARLCVQISQCLATILQSQWKLAPWGKKNPALVNARLAMCTDITMSSRPSTILQSRWRLAPWGKINPALVSARLAMCTDITMSSHLIKVSGGWHHGARKILHRSVLGWQHGAKLHRSGSMGQAKSCKVNAKLAAWGKQKIMHSRHLAHTVQICAEAGILEVKSAITVKNGAIHCCKVVVFSHTYI